jgi:hypothetical protein
LFCSLSPPNLPLNPARFDSGTVVGHLERASFRHRTVTCILLFDVGSGTFFMTKLAGMEGAQSVFLDALAAIQLVGSFWYTL